MPETPTVLYNVDMRTLACGLVLAAIAAAGTAEGKAALTKGDFATALKEFKAASESGDDSESGDKEAQFQLAEMYRLGRGTRTNTRTAAKWYERARAQGHAGATGEIGIALWDRKRKRKEAVAMIDEGARAGHARPAYYLAYLGYSGANRLTDERMYELFKTAAEQGHPDAQAIHGYALYKGKIGGRSDYETAEKWLRKATAQGHPWAFSTLGDCLASLKRPDEAMDAFEQAGLRGVHIVQFNLTFKHLNSDFAKSYAWARIGLKKKYSRVEPADTGEKGRDLLVGRLEKRLKLIKGKNGPKDLRRSNTLFKSYVKRIRANLKKPLPWQRPAR